MTQGDLQLLIRGHLQDKIMATCNHRRHPNRANEWPHDQWTVEVDSEEQFVTGSDDWLALVLGRDLNVAMLRLFVFVVAFLAIGATAAYFAI
jgi:hypothetical protein